MGDLAKDRYETHMYSANVMFVTPRYGFAPFDEVLLVPYFVPTTLSSEEELEDFPPFAPLSAVHSAQPREGRARVPLDAVLEVRQGQTWPRAGQGMPDNHRSGEARPAGVRRALLLREPHRGARLLQEVGPRRGGSIGGPTPDLLGRRLADQKAPASEEEGLRQERALRSGEGAGADRDTRPPSRTRWSS